MSAHPPSEAAPKVAQDFNPHIHPYAHRFYRTFSPHLPDGRHRCRASVYSDGSSHQCSRAGKVEDAGGFWWCGLHSPEGQAKRKATKDDKYQAWLARSRAQAETSARDARLLSAAPEMLEALKQALYLLEVGFDPPNGVPKAADTIIPLVRSAIAKATGS